MQFKNPNIAGEMAQMMVSNQAKYVPSLITPNELNAQTTQKEKKCQVPLVTMVISCLKSVLEMYSGHLVLETVVMNVWKA